MKITNITSYVLQHDLPEVLGYSQQYYNKRTAHLVEVQTDVGITGWGECFGPGNVALANQAIVEKLLQPLILGANPLDRELIWHNTYNLLRDHGQKGLLLQSLSGIDIALWDIAGKFFNVPLYQLIGGKFRDKIKVYGYGMMLRPQPLSKLQKCFADEAKTIKASGYQAMKMKIGLGVQQDIDLVKTVRDSIGNNFQLMVDANHCYTTADALYVGQALEEMGVYWFEEPVAPEDYEGYQELRQKLNINIAGGEAEFTRWGWRRLLEKRCVDIAQPEVCALGGISEYLKVVTLAHAHFTPVINHVWGSALAVAVNLHLLSALPPLPGGLFPNEPLLEFDTTHNLFLEKMPIKPLNIKQQVQASGGFVSVPNAPGHGVVPKPEFLTKYCLVS